MVKFVFTPRKNKVYLLKCMKCGWLEHLTTRSSTFKMRRNVINMFDRYKPQIVYIL